MQHPSQDLSKPFGTTNWRTPHIQTWQLHRHAAILYREAKTTSDLILPGGPILCHLLECDRSKGPDISFWGWAWGGGGSGWATPSSTWAILLSVLCASGAAQGIMWCWGLQHPFSSGSWHTAHAPCRLRMLACSLSAASAQGVFLTEGAFCPHEILSNIYTQAGEGRDAIK